MTTSRSSTSNTSREQVCREVRQIVAEQIGMDVNSVREDHLLVEDLGFDSLDKVESTMEVEDHFDISIPDELADRVRRVADIIEGVWQRLHEGDPAP
ncbi:MAG: acyl carrier protein [Rhodopirellula sp.]|nr:acyl carrier protein [Rhodopirellula sp.]